MSDYNDYYNPPPTTPRWVKVAIVVAIVVFGILYFGASVMVNVRG